MAMMAASAFSFIIDQFDKSGAYFSAGFRFNYIYCSGSFLHEDYWASFGESPTFFRYVDWVLTVPLMCVEFYLILK
jgi:bacteriorhodopsin